MKIQIQFGLSIHTFRSDNSLEYLFFQFQKFMTHQKIIHQTSCLYYTHLIETAHSLAIEFIFLCIFWDNTVLASGCLIFYFITPRVFGSTCFVIKLVFGKDKLAHVAFKCVTFGYSRV